MQQVRPGGVPQPQHGRALAAEGALALGALAVDDGAVDFDAVAPAAHRERVVGGAQVDGAQSAAHLAADGAVADLVGHRRVRVAGKLHRPAMAAPFQTHDDEQDDDGHPTMEDEPHDVDCSHGSTDKGCALQTRRPRWTSTSGTLA